MPDDNKDKPVRVKAEGYRSVYVNASTMGFSAWDFQMTLSKASGLAGERTLEEQVTVIQSPVHAKAMLRSLARTVALYEVQHGRIPDVNKAESAKETDAAADKPTRSKRS